MDCPYHLSISAYLFQIFSNPWTLVERLSVSKTATNHLQRIMQDSAFKITIAVRSGEFYSWEFLIVFELA